MDKLKQKLMATGKFVDNEMLDDYIKLCQTKAKVGYLERHHIIPFNYFADKTGTITKADKQHLRRLCAKQSAAEYNFITAENIVYLTYYQHCLAHYYLFKCTTGKLKYNNEVAFNRMVDRNLILRDCSETEIYELLQLIQKIDLDPTSLRYRSEQINKVLLANYCTGGYKECADILKKQFNIKITKESIKARANRLNLVSNNFTTVWTDLELDILQQQYPIAGWRGAANFLPGRTKNAIQSRAKYLKLIAPGASKANAAWSELELEILHANYPVGGWRKVQKLLNNRSEKSIKHLANRCGLTVIKESK